MCARAFCKADNEDAELDALGRILFNIPNSPAPAGSCLTSCGTVPTAGETGSSKQ